MPSISPPPHVVGLRCLIIQIVGRKDRDGGANNSRGRHRRGPEAALGKGCPDGSEGLAGHRSVEEVFRKCAALIAFAANPLLLAHGVAERGLYDG